MGDRAARGWAEDHDRGDDGLRVEASALERGPKCMTSNDDYDEHHYDDPHYESDLAEAVSKLLSGVVIRIGDVRCLTFAATFDASRLRGETHPAFHIRPDFTFMSVRPIETALAEETEKGYPTYHGLATLALWSVLEAFTEDVCLACLEFKPDVLRDDFLTGRVPVKELVAYAGMSAEARREYLLQQLDRPDQQEPQPSRGKPPLNQQEPKPSHGKRRLERQLKAFGLSVKASGAVNNALCEFYAVRNVLAHRNGRTDRRFVELCPWSGLTEGAELLVSDAKLDYFGKTAMHYATLVTMRVFERVNEHAPNLPSLLQNFQVDSPLPFR